MGKWINGEGYEEQRSRYTPDEFLVGGFIFG